MSSMLINPPPFKGGFASLHNKLPIFLLFAILSVVHPAAAQAIPKNVLILSGGPGRLSINQMEASLRSHFSPPVNFSIVDLDNPRFNDDSYHQHLAEAIQDAYSGEKLDLIVAVMTPSLQFAVQYRDKIFPGVPIVFMSISTPLPEKIWPGVTGVASTTGITETIDLALRLQPDTKTFAIISTGEYSGVVEFEVFLTRVSNEIHLRVHDAGAGFDFSAINGHGLGLTSMKERLKLVRGHLSIDSRPGHGTTILARVPLDAPSTSPKQKLYDTVGAGAAGAGTEDIS